MKHLCLYLLSVPDFSLRLHMKLDGLWHSPPDDNGMVIELFSDSDWAAHKGHRRSVSAGIVCFQGCLLLATSRTQRVIALSSAEAQIHAAVSTTCDGLLLRVCLEFCIGCKVRLKLILDNSAAKQVLHRSGVGRIRHLSCRVLWVQQLVKTKALETPSIPTKENFADLGTKKLSADRMRYLMHGVGVYDENAGELVVTDVVTKERASDDFRGVLRMLRESIGERANHKTMVATKRSLQTLLLLSLVHSTDALSLTSPIPFSVLEQLQLHGLSCWMASMLILYFMFASLLIAMPPRRDMWDEQPGGLFIEPAFSTFPVFVIDFIPQIAVVLHLSQSSISLKSTRVLFTGYVKNLSGTLFFSALSVLHNFCSELGEVFAGTVFPSPLPSANMRPNLAIEQD